MKKRIPIGASDFKDIIETNNYYIDKTLFIKELINDGSRITLFPRPRRFGKTLNLSTLRYFFDRKNAEENRKLFSGLNIEKEKEFEHQGRYPLIYLTFKDVKNNQWEDCFHKIKNMIFEVYSEHIYLLDSDKLNAGEKEKINRIINEKAEKPDYEDSVKKLSGYLFKHYNEKVIILIDEYDIPIQQGYLHNFYDTSVEFAKNFFSASFKDNSALYKGSITGILRVAKESIFSGLNNLKVYSILEERYSEYFGFTESEVENFLKDFDLSGRYPAVKEWYDGYTFGEIKIYNPWSIINFISDGGSSLKPYWVNTSSNDLISKLVLEQQSGVRDNIDILYKGGSIESELNENIIFKNLKTDEELYSFLFFSGYLRIRTKKENGYELELTNYEVKLCFRELIKFWYAKVSENVQRSTMLEALLDGDIEYFQNEFQKYLLTAFSYFNLNVNQTEKVYQSFMLGMLTAAVSDYNIESERERGFGRVDISICHKNDKSKPAIILELKKLKKDTVEKTLDIAMEQINKKLYSLDLQNQGYSRIIKIAVVFDGKNSYFRF